MANTITLRRRINSIKNTRQITKAMELVSASKMRKAQTQAARSRDYRNAANRLLLRLSTMSEVERQPLFRKRKVRTRLYVVITSNSGLAGAYNANVLKLLTGSIQQDRKAGVKSRVITIGNKAAQYVRRLQNVELLAAYHAFGDEPTANDIRPVLNTLVDSFRGEEIDEAGVIYTQFVSQLNQITQHQILLPAHAEDSEERGPAISNFEPDVETVLHHTAVRLIEAQLWQALLESLASEHSMRMVAMKNATDNANELIDDYTLEYNTARQGAITQELAEISGGVEALKD
ncbi:MAG TPA: ATP synthase F1 subunit gamma [Candidatus Saccharimonadales bacterium]|nr:ATP synthase F1 subunit gamma [Candidatus Saccharimonadales bacterium]